MNRFSDSQPQHWETYGRFQQVKHELIRRYLEGWYPKLGYWAGRVVYFDTHAGRGSYAGDNPGSPVVALRTLLRHTALPDLLERSEFRFVFLEKDERNEAALREQVAELEPLPDRILVQTGCEDAFTVLRDLVDTLKSDGRQIAPAFVFVDPYGFGLPGDLLAELMTFERVELFVNVMWRELDMAMRQEPGPGHGQAENLDLLFGSDAWRSIRGETMVERADSAARLLADGLGAKWWTHIRMISGGDAVRFFLLHLTNHDDGRDLMKECVWQICPGGRMNVRRSDNPDQLFLVEPKPDITVLRDWLLQRLQSGPVPVDTLKEELRSMIWRWKHLRDVEADLKKQGRMERQQGTLSLRPFQEELF